MCTIFILVNNVLYMKYHIARRLLEIHIESNVFQGREIFFSRIHLPLVHTEVQVDCSHVKMEQTP